MKSFIDELLKDQGQLTAVEQFARWHQGGAGQAGRYQDLLPATRPGPGQQYAFEVDLDKCSGCKACVTACHALNGLDDDESWRSVGLLISPTTPGARPEPAPLQQHVTTACHHCVDPGCLNGCPVLAYDKDPITGIVRHLDDQCMGCSYCVMKCPYEVPRYSERLGIVRKCDLCSNRLAVGEAPACAQACPSQAIRITVVNQLEVQARYRITDDEVPGSLDAPSDRRPQSDPRSSSPSPNRFLPDSPDPAQTLPTTRYVSQRTLPPVVAADHATLRLDPAHDPLVVMLLLTQSAVGLLLASLVAAWAGTTEYLAPLNTMAWGLLCGGLGASVLHLGRPSKAWRSFLGWRRSWLSREILAFNALAALATGAVAAAWFPMSRNAQLSWTGAAALSGVLGVVASSMVYVDTGRAFWRARLTFGSFFGTTLLLGATIAAVILAWSGRGSESGQEMARLAAVGATVIRTVLFTWRQWEVHRAVNCPSSPIHLNARVTEELLPGSVRSQGLLFVVATVTSLLAIGNVAGAAGSWATLAAISTLASEWIGRRAYFLAGASRRMPGGVTP